MAFPLSRVPRPWRRFLLGLLVVTCCFLLLRWTIGNYGDARGRPGDVNGQRLTTKGPSSVEKENKGRQGGKKEVKPRQAGAKGGYGDEGHTEGDRVPNYTGEPTVSDKRLNAENQCTGSIYRQGNDGYDWQKVTNSTYLFSAYLEHRQTQSAVRVVGVMEWRKPPSWCHLFYKNQTVPQKLRVHARVIPESHGKRFAATDFICYLTSRRQRPCGVTLTQEQEDPLTGFVPITSRYNTRSPPANFTSCIPPLFNFNDTYVLTENIELKRQFGSDRLVVYIESALPEVRRYLDYYVKAGVVEVVPWRLPAVSEIHYHGQLAALTDCMLRSMYTSRYVAFSDIDEVVVPTNASNWLQMIQNIQSSSTGIAVFLFRNSFVSLACEDQPFPDVIDGVSLDVQTLAKRHRVMSLLKRRRSDPPHPPLHYSKCVVDPQGVDTVGIHTMHGLRQRFWKANVLPSHGQLWHYRKVLPCRLLRSVSDDRMLAFAKPLTMRISKVHSAVKKSIDLNQEFV